MQSDERLIGLTRRGHNGAFEALVQRYQPRLLAFCRHMLGSTEDAEDVLQEVFTASYNAMLADERQINARPWLYRIARNRCLNQLRRPVPAGQDSMDVFERDGGTTAADTVHKREELRQVVADVQDLPETQRTALLLREIDVLSYEQIAEAMETTVPSVKSLLVRARVSLAEAAEARLLSCDEVRLELGQVAEGIGKTSAPARRHVRSCDRCQLFKEELRKTSRALAAVYPLGPLIVLKKLLATKLGTGGFAGSGSGAGGGLAGGGSTAAGASAAAGTGSSVTGGAALAGGASTVAAGASVAGSASAGGLLSAGLGALTSKAAVGLAAAAIIAAGAVEVKEATEALPPAAGTKARADAATPATPGVVPAPEPGTRLPASSESSPPRDEGRAADTEPAAATAPTTESNSSVKAASEPGHGGERTAAATEKKALTGTDTKPLAGSDRAARGLEEDRGSTVVLSPRGTNGAAPQPTSSSPQPTSSSPEHASSSPKPTSSSPQPTSAQPSSGIAAQAPTAGG